MTASLTDPDGSISGLSTGSGTTTTRATSKPTTIDGANSDTYIPKEIDADPANAGNVGNGVTLFARASYTDGHGAGKFAVGEAGEGGSI